MENGAFLEGRVIPVKLVEGGIPELDPDMEGMELLRKLTRNGGPNFNIQISEIGELSPIR